MRGGRRPRRLWWLVALLVVPALVASLGVAWHRSRNVRLPLLTAAVGLDGTGRLGPAPATAVDPFLAGSRVFAPAGLPGTVTATTSVLRAAEQRAWLAEHPLPGGDGPYRDLVAHALLDIHTLTLPSGAVLAGWPRQWRYVWPRDASFTAAALAAAGHGDDAVALLAYLQDLAAPGGVFQARYLPDSAEVPDRRGEQSDGTGLVLWATDQVVADAADDGERRRIVERLARLIDVTAQAALRLTDDGRALPPPSPDYWEVHHDRLSLGTVGPLAAGLAAAGRLYAVGGDPVRSRRCEQAADRLQRLIDTHFRAAGYPRYLGDDARDGASAYLLPPFTDTADPARVAAWRAAAQEMRRPAGGLAPGAGWKSDGISWTPTTTLFAVTAAHLGDPARAHRWLQWVDTHRTPLGALPEKVLSDGSPAGPAPLTLTAALVVLAVAALDDTGPDGGAPVPGQPSAIGVLTPRSSATSTARS